MNFSEKMKGVNRTHKFLTSSYKLSYQEGGVLTTYAYVLTRQSNHIGNDYTAEC